MLVLSRRPQETIVLDGRITITVVEVCGNQVRLGIEAPLQVAIQRGELRLNSNTKPRGSTDRNDIAQVLGGGHVNNPESVCTIVKDRVAIST